MSVNGLIKSVSGMSPTTLVGRGLRRFLRPGMEVVRGAVGPYDLRLDLSLGYLQKELFLFSYRYEAETQALMREVVKPGMTVLDIGANVGFFSMLLGHLVTPSGRVHSFEPHPRNHELLSDNIASNRMHWVRVHRTALSNQPGEVTLNLNPVNDGGHSLGDFSNNPDLRGRDRSALAVRVPCDTLDSFIVREKIASVDFIKIDVEGAEQLVFEGGRGLLARSDAPMIVCEVGDAAQQQFGKTEKDVRDALYAHGYRSFFIRDRIVPFGPETPVEGMQNILFRK